MGSSDDEYDLIGNKGKKYRKRRTKNNVLIVGTVLLILFSGCFTAKKIIDSSRETKRKLINANKILFEDFVSVFTNGTSGPITINRNLDDGEKINMYSKMLDLDDNKIENFLNYEYSSLEETIEMEPKFMCERAGGLTEDGSQGYDLVCPLFYKIVIDEAFYGRYAHDDQRCIYNYKNERVSEETLAKYRNVTTDCGTNYNSSIKSTIKQLCEGKSSCTILPNKTMFPDTCKSISKYLHLSYYCTKVEELKVPKMAIVMYANKVKVNSLYENAISEFYQYADIHGYKFMFSRERYDTARDLFYMKLHVITEAIIKGLKEKEYEWIFWVDGDTMLANPNIKLEAFIPTDNNIHFIAASDKNGLNAGVFLIRVNPWSLNFMMRSISYLYYNPKMRLEFADQTSMNNVLISDKEDKHYVIVPQDWFNKYQHYKKPGDFLIHFAGRKDKDGESKQHRAEVYSNPDWCAAKTNKQVRKDVLEYYNRPRDKQKSIWFDDN